MKNILSQLSNHKKATAIICVIVIILCITGIYFTTRSSSKYSTSVSNGNSTAIKANDITITKDDIYYYLLENYGSNQVINDALNYICDKEITDQKAIDKKVNETKESYESYSKQSLADYIKSIGYTGTEDQYIKEMIEPDAKQQLLKEKYVEANFNKLVKQYKVKYLKIITVDTESQALKLIKSCTNEDNFNQIMSDNNGSDAGLVTTKSSTIDKNIIKKLDSFTKDGIYKKAIKTSDSKYAIIWTYNTNKKEKKSEIKEALTNISDLSTKANAYYFKKYNFDVYETQLKDEIKKESKEYFG